MFNPRLIFLGVTKIVHCSVLSKIWLFSAIFRGIEDLKTMNKPHFISIISNRSFPLNQRVLASMVDAQLLSFIQRRYPSFVEGVEAIAISELNAMRQEYIGEKLVEENGALSKLQEDVLNSMREQTLLSQTMIEEDNEPLTLGQRLSDKVASFGGSWTFIISFCCFLMVWVIVNSIAWFGFTKDPYPFIFLNLILSCIAALQAPIIMMSQNRQEEKDRERSKKDYMVNLKSELEIRLLHDKMDHLILHQQQELIEIQKIQMDMLNDILKQTNKGRS